MEQANSIFYILQQYSILPLIEGKEERAVEACCLGDRWWERTRDSKLSWCYRGTIYCQADVTFYLIDTESQGG